MSKYWKQLNNFKKLYEGDNSDEEDSVSDDEMEEEDSQMSTLDSEGYCEDYESTSADESSEEESNKKEKGTSNIFSANTEHLEKIISQRHRNSDDVSQIETILLHDKLQKQNVSIEDYRRGEEIEKKLQKLMKKQKTDLGQHSQIWEEGFEEILKQKTKLNGEITNISFQAQFNLKLNETQKCTSQLTETQKKAKHKLHEHLLAQGHTSKFKVHAQTRPQVFTASWRMGVGLEVTDVRRQLYLKMQEHFKKLQTAKKKKQKKIRKQITLILKALQELEVLTSKCDEIQWRASLKADANFEGTLLEHMDSIWKINENAAFQKDYEKHRENKRVKKLPRTLHPLNKAILRPWEKHEITLMHKANPQIAPSTKRDLVNPKKSSLEITAQGKKRKNTFKEKNPRKRGKYNYRKGQNGKRNGPGKKYKKNGNSNPPAQRWTKNLKKNQLNTNPRFFCPIHKKQARRCPKYCRNNPHYDIKLDKNAN